MLMDVMDSSKHMAKGGIKDTKYLSKQIIPVMLTSDLHGVLFNMAVFDGAGNVQNWGQAIATRFPHVITIHGGGMFIPSLLVKFFRSHV